MGCCTFKPGCQLQSEFLMAMQTCRSWMQQEGTDISQRGFSMVCLMACTVPQQIRRRLCPRLHTLCASLQSFEMWHPSTCSLPACKL